VKRVFVDSGAFFALVAGEDRFHERALELFAQASSEKWRLVTTNAVVIETSSRPTSVPRARIVDAGLVDLVRTMHSTEAR